MNAAAPSRSVTRRIGRRLTVWVVAFSSLLTLFITAFQLFADYRRDRAEMEKLLEEARVLLPPIAASVWTFNDEQIRLALAAMIELPNIEYAQVVTNDEKQRWEAGRTRSVRVVARSYPLQIDTRGTQRTIGRLDLVASLDAVLERVVSRAIAVLVGNAVKTFLVVIFMLFLFRRLVTNRLERLSAAMDALPPELMLPRAAAGAPPPVPRQGADEIDVLQSTFDQVSNRLKADVEELQQAYTELRAVNQALEEDIEARRAAETEITRLNRELEERVRLRTAELMAANEELAAFSYSVSHDLRAPLRRIDGFSAILAEDHGERLDESGRDYLRRMRNGAREMGEMIDAFLMLSRAVGGELSIERIDLTALANEIAETLRQQEPDRAVCVEIEVGMATVGDLRLMRIVLENLIGNAWKYTRRTTDAGIRIARKAGVDEIFCVADNGAGFEQAAADKLFRPFQRLHAASEFEGTGIGLATVQRALRRMGGRAWAEAEPGRGAKFYFSLRSETSVTAL